MRNIHIISVTDPLMLDLSLAIHAKGYAVSVSGEGLTTEAIAKLHAAGCSCYGNGWFPERLQQEAHFVVLGATVRKDNPELLRARELGLLVLSVPEFIFQRTKEKTRVVVAGSRGKKTVLSMIAYALQRQKMLFDYALTSEIPLLPNCFSMSYEARIALIEGDESATSTLEKRFQLEFFRPHIAILANLSWTPDTDHADPVAYYNTFRNFTRLIEREGKLIYFEGDPAVKQLAEEVREDITAIPYTEQTVAEVDGVTVLQTRYGDFPLQLPDPYFLTNLNAARLACRQLGVKDVDFYQAISEYSVSLSL